MKHLLFSVLLLAGCGSPSTFKSDPVSNDAGQTITYVGSDDLHGWVKEHTSLKIVSITSYSGSQYGTSGYVIVYETPKVEK